MTHFIVLSLFSFSIGGDLVKFRQIISQLQVLILILHIYIPIAGCSLYSNSRFSCFFMKMVAEWMMFPFRLYANSLFLISPTWSIYL